MGHPAEKKTDSNSAEQIARIAFDLTGVQLTQRHFPMISSRLHRRIQGLGLVTMENYLDYLKKNMETEREFLITALTTHHTYFFREFAHFDFLKQKGLDHAIEQAKRRGDGTIRIWSAACSRGQEVYSLAMWIQPLLQERAPNLKLDILGTDVDAQSIRIAENAVYPWNDVKEIPMQFLDANWVRGRGEIANFAKVRKPCRSVCRFETQNLFAPKFKNQEKPFDIIFCRNVFIYFKPEQVAAITETLLKNCGPEGLLILGLSESLHGLSVPAKLVGPSIYVKPEHSWVAQNAQVRPPKSPPVLKIVPPAPAPAEKIRVLVVDDSPTIHTLMKRVFTADQDFEIVGNAMNGIEAKEKLKTCKADVVTLDIHMPEQDGVTYLQNNFGPSHPPVIMVTSVSRADSEFAIKALRFGASDYVEKPDIRNLESMADEIRTKVRCAVLNRKAPTDFANSYKLDKSFRSTLKIEAPNDLIRILAVQPSDRTRIGAVIDTWNGKKGQPPLIIFADADSKGENILHAEFERTLGRVLKTEADLKKDLAKQDEIYLILRSGETGTFLARAVGERRCSVLATGELSKAICDQIRAIRSGSVQFILEDLGPRNSKHHLAEVADDLSPLSGFAYFSDRFLCQKG